jgi:hypothetical protein
VFKSRDVFESLSKTVTQAATITATIGAPWDAAHVAELNADQMQTTANWLRTRAWKATDAKTDVRDGSGEINENITTLTHSDAARSSQKMIGERRCILTRIRGVAQWLVKRQNNQFAEWRRVEFVTLSVLTPEGVALQSPASPR